LISMNKITFVALLGLTLLLNACKKDTIVEDPQPELPPLANTNDSTSLMVSFTAIANNKTLRPVYGTYSNTSKDGFTVTKFNYYISNIKLYRDNGTVYVEPESYHIIKHVDSLTSFSINRLPEGTYNRVEFLIGVDSLRNVSGAQKGALDPKHEMFWTW